MSYFLSYQPYLLGNGYTSHVGCVCFPSPIWKTTCAWRSELFTSLIFIFKSPLFSTHIAKVLNRLLIDKTVFFERWLGTFSGSIAYAKIDKSTVRVFKSVQCTHYQMNEGSTGNKDDIHKRSLSELAWKSIVLQRTTVAYFFPGFNYVHNSGIE